MAKYIRKSEPFEAHQFDSSQPTSTFPTWLQKLFQECELEIVSGYSGYDKILGKYITLSTNSNNYFIVRSEYLNHEKACSSPNEDIWLNEYCSDGDYIALYYDEIIFYEKKYFETNYEIVGE